MAWRTEGNESEDAHKNENGSSAVTRGEIKVTRAREWVHDRGVRLWRRKCRGVTGGKDISRC